VRRNGCFRRCAPYEAARVRRGGIYVPVARAIIPRVTVACVQCGTPLSVRGICGQRQRRPPAFDRTLAIFRYQAPLDALIKKWKFNGDLHIARLLGTMMADRLTVGEIMPDLIVPVPLHV
jgi:predicted amidophosphoribosyltransferase